MRYVILTLLFTRAVLGANAIVNCSSATLGQTYSTSTPSLQASLTNIPYGSGTLVIVNASSTRICANTVTTSTSVAPTAGNGNEHCVAANAYVVLDKINAPYSPFTKVNVYLRADSSDCTAAIVDVDLY